MQARAMPQARNFIVGRRSNWCLPMMECRITFYIHLNHFAFYFLKSHYFETFLFVHLLHSAVQRSCVENIRRWMHSCSVIHPSPDKFNSVYAIARSISLHGRRRSCSFRLHRRRYGTRALQLESRMGPLKRDLLFLSVIFFRCYSLAGRTVQEMLISPWEKLPVHGPPSSARHSHC